MRKINQETFCFDSNLYRDWQGMICAGLTGSTGSVRDKTEILHLKIFWDP